MAGVISEKTVGRLSLYRRILNDLLAESRLSIYSHELAKMAKVSAAQVRRDVMIVGYTGSPIRGYDTRGLMESIEKFYNSPETENVALVGVGNLGRALLSYFAGGRRNLTIAAAFDRDPQKVGRVINGCRVYPLDELGAVAKELGIGVGILAVPASEAQSVAEACVRAGMRGVMNFAPAALHLPPGVYTLNIDLTIELEKAAFFTRQGR